MSDRRRLALFVVPMVAVAAVATVGDALAPTLLVDAPLLLTAMVPRLRYLILTAPLVDFWPWVVVGMVRLTLTDPIFFFFGRRYGDAGIRWVEAKSGADVRRLERWFAKAAHPVTAIAPNNIVCVLAGATGMRTGVFLALNLGGTVVRMALVWWLGDVFRSTLLDLVDLVARYRLPLTALSIAVVVVLVWRGRRMGTSELETLDEIERELDAYEHPPDAPEPER